MNIKIQDDISFKIDTGLCIFTVTQEYIFVNIKDINIYFAFTSFYVRVIDSSFTFVLKMLLKRIYLLFI